MPGKRNQSTKPEGAQQRSTRGANVAKAGAGALILGLLTWLTGGFTRENGIEWLKSIAVALGIALVFRWSLTEPFKIPSESMVPTLKVGDRIFVNKFVYGLRFPFMNRRIWHNDGPQRWDIVVFKSVEDHPEHKTLVKRVVGLPGERIHIANGKVHVNGEALELPDGMPRIEYTTSGRYGVATDDRFAVVPEGCYLLLGDNSARSRDGRTWGWMPNEHIVGRVSCIGWPISRWRDFTGFSDTWWWRTLVLVLGVLLFVRLFLGRSWRVPEAGVSDSLAKGDHVYVNRWCFGVPIPFTRSRFYRGRGARRGELVAYYAPDESESAGQVFVGRVAGLPEEHVQFKSDRLCINGAPVAEPASLAGRTFSEANPGGPYARSKGKRHSQVPGGHYFILSDSPEHGEDSRTLGWIPHRDLIGVVSAVWWPPRRWRRLRP
ncbi:MAG: signal peptidase I [Candidatus Hydrogenedentes bacterium]|nr:signal peptidase I [Candidatus Hydrogenedentota bacterium]